MWWFHHTRHLPYKCIFVFQFLRFSLINIFRWSHGGRINQSAGFPCGRYCRLSQAMIYNNWYLSLSSPVFGFTLIGQGLVSLMSKWNKWPPVAQTSQVGWMNRVPTSRYGRLGNLHLAVSWPDLMCSNPGQVKAMTLK